MPMDRVTLRVPAQQVEAIEERVDSGEFPTKSEAIRAAIRAYLAEEEDPRRWTKIGGSER